jgi:hypothetical protein
VGIVASPLASKSSRQASPLLTSKEEQVGREDRLRFRLRVRLKGRLRDRLRFRSPSGSLRGFPCTHLGFRAGATPDIYMPASGCPVSRPRSGDPFSLVCALLLRGADCWLLRCAALRGSLCAVRFPLRLLAAFACRVVASRRRLCAPAARPLAGTRLARSTLAGLSYAAQPPLSRRAGRRDHAQVSREGA